MCMFRQIQIMSPLMKRLTSLSMLQGKYILGEIPPNSFLGGTDGSKSPRFLVAHFCCSIRRHRIGKATVKHCPIPSPLETFLTELYDAPTKTPRDLGYSQSAGQIIHDMLTVEGKRRQRFQENIPLPWEEYRQFNQHDELLLQSFPGENQLLTLLHLTRQFYKAHAIEAVPITGRKKLPWCKRNCISNEVLSVQHVKETWKSCICPEDHPAATRASSVLNDLKISIASLGEFNIPICSIAERQIVVSVVNTKLNDKEKSSLFGATTMSNTIFISKQFLEEMAPCNDTLAFTLCHELGHGIANHRAELMCYTHFSMLLIEHIANILKKSSHKEDDELLYKKLEVVAECVTNFLPSSFTLEAEADQIAMHIMAHAGYNLDKVPDFLHLLGTRYIKSFAEEHYHFRSNELEHSTETEYRPVIYTNCEKNWAEKVRDSYRKYKWENIHPLSYSRSGDVTGLVKYIDSIRDKTLHRKVSYYWYMTKTMVGTEKIAETLKETLKAIGSTISTGIRTVFRN